MDVAVTHTMPRRAPLWSIVRADKTGINRDLRMRRDKVKEYICYDHVGLKVCLFNELRRRQEEKISKGKSGLNSMSGIGMDKGSTVFQ